MRLLLDSHIVIWALTDDPRLSTPARQLISDARNEIVVSAVSIWEIAIKFALGRGTMPFSGVDAIDYCRQSGFELIDIRPEHAAAVAVLPALHADPFDRLLLAQARIAPLHLLTADVTVARYGEPVILV
jgi:PIN domain nuclease of toxin-antitoxin system